MCSWMFGGADSGRIGNIGSRQQTFLASCTAAWDEEGFVHAAVLVLAHGSWLLCIATLVARACAVRTTNTPASGQQQQHDASRPRARKEKNPSSRRPRIASHGK